MLVSYSLFCWPGQWKNVSNWGFVPGRRGLAGCDGLLRTAAVGRRMRHGEAPLPGWGTSHVSSPRGRAYRAGSASAGAVATSPASCAPMKGASAKYVALGTIAGSSCMRRCIAWWSASSNRPPVIACIVMSAGRPGGAAVEAGEEHLGVGGRAPEGPLARALGRGEHVHQRHLRVGGLRREEPEESCDRGAHSVAPVLLGAVGMLYQRERFVVADVVGD